MKRDCLHIQERIDDYIDGTLSPSEKSDLQRHLSECEACRIRLQDEQRIISLIESLPLQVLPEEVVNRIEDRTVRKTHGNSAGQWLRERLIIPRWPKVAVGFAVVAIAVFIVLKSLPESVTPDPATFSEADARNAKLKAKWSLVYISDLMKKTEKRVVADILLKDMPSTIKKSLEKSLPLLKGGR